MSHRWRYIGFGGRLVTGDRVYIEKEILKRNKVILNKERHIVRRLQWNGK